MGFKSNKPTLTKLIDSKIIDFLILAAATAKSEIIKDTPVISGNLKSSNTADNVDTKNLSVRVKNTANYASIVEIRRQFFSRGLLRANTKISQLLKKIKI